MRPVQLRDVALGDMPLVRIGDENCGAVLAADIRTLAVLLRGNTRSVKGPMAAVVAGRIYRKLREQNYFAESTYRRQYTASAGASK